MDIFNLTAEAIETAKAANKALTPSDAQYKPSPKQGRDGHYRAVVRFLPNPEASTQEEFIPFSMVPSYYRWFGHLDGGLKKFTTPERCVFDKVFFDSRKSESARVKEAGAIFMRKQEWFSYVEIIEDPQRPDLVGQIMIFSYGKKVHDKIMEEFSPIYGTPKNPFNCLTGRVFCIDVKELGGYPNWDSCRFQDGAPLVFEGVQIGTPEFGALREKWLAQFPKGIRALGDPEWTETKERLAKTIISGVLPDYSVE